ncbi:MAG: CBS domain-containing protein, partial [Phenylobacterium sp.]
MKVSEAMTAQVVTASPETTVAEVARQMSRIDSGAMPILEGGRVVGLVTDRDIVVRVVAEGRSFDSPVSAIMTDGVQSCRQDDSVADAAAQMGAQQIRRLV